MCDSNVSKARRITAGIIGLMMLFVMLFSAFYMAAEADHDCSGEDCPICACIQQCENTLRLFGGGEIRLLSVIIPTLFILPAAALCAAAVPQDTLVSRKVRLNN